MLELKVATSDQKIDDVAKMRMFPKGISVWSVYTSKKRGYEPANFQQVLRREIDYPYNSR